MDAYRTFWVDPGEEWSAREASLEAMVAEGR